MIDNKFTEELEAFLQQDKDKQDAVKGAQYLVRINPRNASYRRFLQIAGLRPKQILAKIIRELTIHLKYRLAGLTLQAVNKLDQEITKKMNELFDDEEETQEDEEVTENTQSDSSNDVNKRGKRSDHDSLPEKIKKLWDDNADIYKKMRETFNELKARSDEPACQRYDLLQLLTSMDAKYRKNMKKYDEYKDKKNKEK